MPSWRRPCRSPAASTSTAIAHSESTPRSSAPGRSCWATSRSWRSRPWPCPPCSTMIPGYQWGYLWTVAGWDVYFTWAMVGILGSILMTWINIRGIQTAAVFQAVVTVVILIGGGALMIGGVSLGDGANLQPLFVDGAKGVL